MHTSIALSRPIEVDRLPAREPAARTVECSRATLSRLSRELERRNRIVAIAAHELRGPLGSIRGLAEFLDEGAGGPLTPTQHELINVIHNTSRSVLSLIDDLLDLAALTAAELKLRMDRHDVAPLISQVVAMMNLEAASKQSRVVFQRPATATYLQLDAEKFAQLLRNLLGNAIKYSPPHSTITVQFEPDPRQGWCVLRVRDQGPGIPDGERERLFEAFGRLSNLPTSGEKSTGLGLAICRKIAEAHHGSIEAENLPMGGCEFRVMLPMSRPDVERMTPALPASRRTPQTAA